MTSGQLMSNGWLQMDKAVLENQRKRQQQAHEKTQQQKEKRQKQDNKQSEEYQKVLEQRTTTKEKLTMRDYHEFLKQLLIKGDKPFGKNKMEIMQQLSKRIN
jgi:hypothetical protein